MLSHNRVPYDVISENTYSTRIVEDFVLIVLVDHFCRNSVQTFSSSLEDGLQEGLDSGEHEDGNRVCDLIE